MAKPKGPPKIVLHGKQSKSNDSGIVKGILSKIEPSDIPTEFLHKIVVNTVGGDSYSVNDNQKNISYTNIDKYIRQLGIKDDIESVEIVIDLDKVRLHLEKETNSILKKIFKE